MTVDGATRGIRCAAKNGNWWCSRDAGHPGAHESRNSDGRGLIAWWNSEYLRPNRVRRPRRRGFSPMVDGIDYDSSEQ